MSAGYAVVSVLVAVVALFGTALVLRRWDRPVEAAEIRPWWRTWQRTALLAVFAFGFGTIGPLSGGLFRGAQPMFVVTYCVLPLVYNLIRIRVVTFRIEQVLLWSTWTFGAVAVGGDLWNTASWALILLVVCLTFGAVIIKLGVTTAWKWKAIWSRQK